VSEPVDAEPDVDDGLIDAALLDARIADAGSSSAAAWNRLLALWTLRSEDADVRTAARCPLVLALGVYCLRSSGSLSKLSTLRRPVILRLAAEGREAWGVLLGLSNHRARLAIGGETFDISRTQLEQVWLGEFHTIWRAPAFVSMPIRRGDSGPSVDWLRDILQRRDLLRSDLLGPAYFDAALETGVRRLQSAHGLVPDGIVGPETLLALTAEERGGPRLRRTLN